MRAGKRRPIRAQRRGRAFASDRDGDFDVYVARPDGGGVRNLTRNAASSRSEADDHMPAWSPDGRLIAFVSSRDHASAGIEDLEIYVMSADGRGPRRLTDATASTTSSA